MRRSGASVSHMTSASTYDTICISGNTSLKNSDGSSARAVPTRIFSGTNTHPIPYDDTGAKISHNLENIVNTRFHGVNMVSSWVRCSDYSAYSCHSWIHFATISPNTVSPRLSGKTMDSPCINANALGIDLSMSIDLGYCPEKDVIVTYLSCSQYGEYFPIFERHIRCHDISYDGNTETDEEKLEFSATGFPSTINNYDLIIDTPPSVSYDGASSSIVVKSSMFGKKILEFRNLSSVSPTGITDEETLMNFYLSSLIWPEGRAGSGYAAYFGPLQHDTENGWYYDNVLYNGILKWRRSRGAITVSLNYASASMKSDKYQRDVDAGVNNAIDQMNLALEPTGLTLMRNDSLGKSADIVVTYGTMELFGMGKPSKNNLQGGQWETSGDSYTDHAEVQVTREAVYYTTFKQVCLEEIYQCFGCGVDQLEYPTNTCTNDFGGAWNGEQLSEKDKNMLVLLYSDATSLWEQAKSLAITHNIPYGVFFSSEDAGNTPETINISGLERGNTYQFRAWVINAWVDSDGVEHCRYSETSDWITVAIPNGPSLWDWHASNGEASAEQTQSAYQAITGRGATPALPYLVWNDLVNKIYEAASGNWSTMYATYNGTKMTPSDRTLTAQRFNAARQNIGSHVSTGINEVAKGDAVLGIYFTTLTDKLNEWINQL